MYKNCLVEVYDYSLRNQEKHDYIYANGDLFDQLTAICPYQFWDEVYLCEHLNAPHIDLCKGCYNETENRFRLRDLKHFIFGTEIPLRNGKHIRMTLVIQKRQPPFEQQYKANMHEHSKIMLTCLLSCRRSNPVHFLKRKQTSP